MRRRLFTLLAGASLLALAGVLLLWVRSHAGGDQLRWSKVESGGSSHYRWYFVIEWRFGGIQLAHDAEVYERSALRENEAALATSPWTRHRYSEWGPYYPRPFF